jgi:hypothetical protein
MKVTNNQIEERMNSGEINPDIYHYWAQVNESLRTFEKKANMKTFRNLFETYQEAERLWGHFVRNCEHKIPKFLTYLTQEQKNELIYNAHENKTFLYS